MPSVVIDPGHGGTDPGNVNNGRQEKSYCLAVSLLLKQALEGDGVSVKMTRSTDVAIGLSERAAFANNLHADLFISKHNDSFSDPAVNGVSVHIYPSTKGTETEAIANKVLNAICAATGQVNKGVRFSDFAVLRETNMPAMLIEGGFNTNVAESAKMADAAFQKLQAEAVAKAVRDHYGLPVEETPFTVQAVQDVHDMNSKLWHMADADHKPVLEYINDHLRKNFEGVN